MKGKRLVTLALALALCVTPALAADAFPAVNAFPGYADVRETDWFYDNVRLCYEAGLMTGTQTGFEPARTLTVGEVAAIAARMREALTGLAIPAPVPNPGLPWYQHYTDYLKDAVSQSGIRFSDELELLEQGGEAVTRLGFLRLLNMALFDQELLAPINNITTLPDSSDPTVLAFYNAGVLTGADEYGTFAGDRTLTRQECAAMVSRVARPELRKAFTPAAVPSGSSQASPSGAPTAEQFARQFLGGEADKVYGYAGNVSITGADYLTHALETTNYVLALLYQQGQSFSWDLPVTSSGATVYEYVSSNAFYGSLQEAWAATLTDAQVDNWAKTSGLMKAKHILVTEENGGKATADMLYDVLKKDMGQFEPLLAVYGEDPGMKSNPDGYVFGPGEMVEPFENGARATAVGEISPPVQSDFGWHIIYRLPLDKYDYADENLETFLDQCEAAGQLGVREDSFPNGIDFTSAFSQWYMASMEARQ